jgi:DNA-binding NarL/FixJ family response regulator
VIELDEMSSNTWRITPHRSGAPTPREIEVVLSRVKYGSNKAAAHDLGISEQTIKNHVGRLMYALDASSFTDVVVKLYREIADRIEIIGTNGELM